MGLRRQGKFGAGLAEELAALLAQLGESGRVPEPLSLADAIAEDARARRGVLAAMDALRTALSQTPPSKTAQAAAEAVAAVGAVTLDHAPSQLPWAPLRAASPRAAARGPLAEPLAATKAAWAALLHADPGARSRRWRSSPARARPRRWALRRGGAIRPPPPTTRWRRYGRRARAARAPSSWMCLAPASRRKRSWWRRGSRRSSRRVSGAEK